MKIKILPPLCIHEVGSRRNQEDSVSPVAGEATVDSRLFLLCDGMGGHEHGEVASQLVCNVLSDYILQHRTDDVLHDSVLLDGMDDVFRQINTLDTGAVKQMGTTLTLLCLHRGGATMAHIGDSRIYHIRPAEGRILYKTRDHSLVYDLFLAGEIEREEMATYGRKNVITRAIMPGMERQPKLDIAHTTDIQPGDYFFLCSDGMLEQMNDRQLMELLAGHDTNESKRQSLVEATSDNADNHTAWIVEIDAVTAEPADDQQKNDEITTKSNAMLLEMLPSEASQRSIWQRVKNLFKI